ncbi:MAG: NYN domain-containing protein [Pseudomonadales bacterium]
MQFYDDEKVALFISGPSIFATAKAIGFDLDYKRLLTHFRHQCQLVRALYYTAIADDQEFSSIQPLVDWLEYNGFTLVTKPTKTFRDSSGRLKYKGNMSVELAVDALRLAPALDHIVLFSGDGDYRALVEALQEDGLRVTVVSTLETQSSMIADELRRQADQFIDLADLEHLVSRDKSHGRRTDLQTSRSTTVA